MVVVLPTLDGLVVCADKRLTKIDSSGVSVRDDQTKILALGTDSGFFALGMLHFDEATSGQPLLHVEEFSSMHLPMSVIEVGRPTRTMYRFTDEPVLQEFGNRLLKRLGLALGVLSQESAHSLSDLLKEDDGRIFDVCVFSADRVIHLKFVLSVSGSSGNLNWLTGDRSGTAFVLGGEYTMKNLVEGNNPSFQKYRSEPIISEFRDIWRSKEAVGKKKAEPSIRYARRLIEIASEIQPPPWGLPSSDISRDSDCVLVTGGPLQWR